MILGGVVGGIVGVLFRDWDKLSTYTLTNWIFEVFLGFWLGLLSSLSFKENRMCSRLFQLMMHGAGFWPDLLPAQLGGN
jgi:hypothetical protein